VTSQLPRKRRRHAHAIALPAAVVVLLAIAGTAAADAGAAPDSPLHAIHTLIFGADKPAPADQVRTLLLRASHDLDLAARSPNPASDPHLTAATKELAAVPPLIAKVTDPVLASSLRADMTALQRRADLLRQQVGQATNSRPTNPPAAGGGGDQTGTTNQDGTPSQPGTPQGSDTNQPGGTNQPSGANQPGDANQHGGTANAS